jgi:hypothetical protein
MSLKPINTSTSRIEKDGPYRDNSAVLSLLRIEKIDNLTIKWKGADHEV